MVLSKMMTASRKTTSGEQIDKISWRKPQKG